MFFYENACLQCHCQRYIWGSELYRFHSNGRFLLFSQSDQGDWKRLVDFRPFLLQGRRFLLGGSTAPHSPLCPTLRTCRWTTHVIMIVRQKWHSVWGEGQCLMFCSNHQIAPLGWVSFELLFVLLIKKRRRKKQNKNKKKKKHNILSYDDAVIQWRNVMS